MRTSQTERVCAIRSSTCFPRHCKILAAVPWYPRVISMSRAFGATPAPRLRGPLVTMSSKLLMPKATLPSMPSTFLLMRMMLRWLMVLVSDLGRGSGPVTGVRYYQPEGWSRGCGRRRLSTRLGVCGSASGESAADRGLGPTSAPDGDELPQMGPIMYKPSETLGRSSTGTKALQIQAPTDLGGRSERAGAPTVEAKEAPSAPDAVVPTSRPHQCSPNTRSLKRTAPRKFGPRGRRHK